ncbi:Spo0B C-terminal domain-containing protein [Peribacillus alkalitolerans]|uniref:Spo0B C-terminal domain-containing protein n=1 Tax=Peribacillus alkalitolerans TaxID=1550385 RepID=UPI0013D1866C|nr:Spo0B C-terminal domain-containing protein [Peribacillus alkalitolerans]
MEKKQWTTIDLLRYSRHDWLNKMQLIKGNLDLNKPDRARLIMEEIILEANNEARLSSLDMPNMAELLLTANWMEYSYSVEFEVIGIDHGCQSADENISRWTSRFLNKLSTSLSLLHENTLKITIMQIEGKIRFSFDIQGKIEKNNELLLHLNQDQHENLEIEIEETNETELVFHVWAEGKNNDKVENTAQDESKDVSKL